MKLEYDFSKGEHGKFYHPGAGFSPPIYLEADVNEFLGRIATEKNIELQDLVNEWLRNAIRAVQADNSSAEGCVK